MARLHIVRRREYQLWQSMKVSVGRWCTLFMCTHGCFRVHSCVCACLCFLQCERTTILLASYGLVTIFVLMCAYINLLFGTCPLSVRCSVGVRRLTCSLVCLACRRQVYTVTVSGVGHCLPECLCHRCLCRGPLPHPLQGPLCAVHAVGIPAPSASVCGTVCQVRRFSLRWECASKNAWVRCNLTPRLCSLGFLRRYADLLTRLEAQERATPSPAPAQAAKANDSSDDDGDAAAAWRTQAVEQ